MTFKDKDLGGSIPYDFPARIDYKFAKNAFWQCAANAVPIPKKDAQRVLSFTAKCRRGCAQTAFATLFVPFHKLGQFI